MVSFRRAARKLDKTSKACLKQVPRELEESLKEICRELELKLRASLKVVQRGLRKVEGSSTEVQPNLRL